MQYRLFTFQRGYKEYLSSKGRERFTPFRAEAWIVSEKTADLWPEMKREEVSEDEAMRLAGAPTLPGLEL